MAAAKWPVLSYLESVLSSVSASRYDAWHSGHVHVDGVGEGQLGEVDVRLEVSRERGGGLGSLQRDQLPLLAELLDAHVRTMLRVELRQLGVEVRDVLLLAAGVDHHVDMIALARDHAVVDDAARLVRQHAQTHLIHGQRLDVANDNALQELDALLAPNAKLAHVAHIEQRSGLRSSERGAGE